MHRHSLRLVSIWLASALLSSFVSAEGLRSPSQTLGLPENRLEVLAAVEPGSDAGRYRFRRTTVDEAVVELRLPEVGPADLVPGSSWWVGFSELKRQPPDPRTFVRDPDGPRVLLLEGVGAALFPATPAVGKVLGALGVGDEDAVAAVGERLSAVIDLLAAPQENLRRLAASEVGLDARLWRGLSAELLQSLGRAFAASSPEPYVRYRLLEAGRGAVAAGVGGASSAAAEWARRALQEAALEADPRTYEPALQIIALETLAAHGTSADAPWVLRLLRSDHSAVGRQAVFSLRSLAPDQLVASAPPLLASEDLDPETRTVLKAVLERLGEKAGRQRPD